MICTKRRCTKESEITTPHVIESDAAMEKTGLYFRAKQLCCNLSALP